ncbi:MAG: hypothetical protein IT443_03090 [Phycisphaeraceae bacterium]|nr:hypothetical protein [Phycisphaeraceae bacterium]
MLSFSLFFQAVLLALGLYWCHEVFQRWRSDWEDFRLSDDYAHRLVILFIWAVTAYIAYLVATSAYRLIARIVLSIQQLLA